MNGGAGNDTYYVDGGDTIVEASNGGTDTVVYSGTTSHSINGTQIENLSLSGTANSNATGSAGDNRLVGNGGNNTIIGWAGDDFVVGGAGNDELIAGLGRDLLFGGQGNDEFRYAAGDFGGTNGEVGDNTDEIFDYTAGDFFNFLNLISQTEVQAAIDAGGDVNDLVRIAELDGDISIEFFEDGIQQNGNDSWATGIVLHGAAVGDLRFQIGDGGATYQVIDGRLELIV
jgi:Ca2+-binding RTX toxin-like protein